MCGSFDEPDVAAVAVKEVEFTDEIEPVMQLLRVEPLTAARCLHTQNDYTCAEALSVNSAWLWY